MILVTGGTGFIGSYLLRELIAGGEQVIAIKRPTSSLELVNDVADRVQWREADILDMPSLEAVLDSPPFGGSGEALIYHCAAVVSHRARDNRHMMRVNIDGTANLVNVCLAHGVRKIVHVSSIAALGRSSRSEDIDETHEWVRSRYNAPYGLSKFRAEREVWRGIAEGLNAVIVNPSVVLGPGQWTTGTGRMFRLVDGGLKIYPNTTTGFVDVRDVVDCMIRFMKSDIGGQRFILSAENRSMKDVLTMIAQALGKRPPRIKATPNLVQLALIYEGLRSLTGKYPRYTRALARNSQTAYSYDNSKVREILGFEFRDLRETVEWVASEYVKQHRNSGSAKPPSNL